MSLSALCSTFAAIFVHSLNPSGIGLIRKIQSVHHFPHLTVEPIITQLRINEVVVASRTGSDCVRSLSWIWDGCKSTSKTMIMR